jgi:hypothetical protein
MGHMGDNQYYGLIPQQLDEAIIEYYIHAEDDSGRIENHPYIGGSWAHTFTCELINDPPNKPVINGNNEGIPFQEYEFTISSTDPDDDNLTYYIDWHDDTTSEWIGPFISGETIIVNHSWEEQKTYTIMVRARDIFNEKSDWSYFDITIPKNKRYSSYFIYNKLIEQFFPRFSILLKNIYKLID